MDWPLMHSLQFNFNKMVILFALVLIVGSHAQDLSIDDLLKQPTCFKVAIQKKCPNENVTFWLYNNKVTEEGGYKLDENSISTIKLAPFNDNPIKILLHGFTGNKTYHPSRNLRPAYLQHQFNVISIDYGKVVPRPCYVQSVFNARVVADCFTKFIHSLLTTKIESRTSKKISINDTHVIGYSLGAQIAGDMGAKLQKIYNLILPRITGLDAAAPLYSPGFSKITKKSATFVDGYHTNTGMLGKFFTIGHVDFYFNALFLQTGCNITDIECHHDKSHEYFAESITSKDPVFCGCNKKLQKTVAGENVDQKARGVYHVKTNNHTLYAKDSASTCK